MQLIHYGQVDIDAEINLNAYLTILANEALIESNDSMETVSLQRNVDQLVMMNAKSDDIIKLIMKIMVVLPTFKTQINDEKLLTIVSKINTYVVALRPLLTKEQALLYANKIDELNEFYRFHFYHASVAVSLLKSSYEIHRQYEGDGEQTIQVLNNLGKAYKELGNKVKAKDCFDLALKIQPQPEANTSHRIARLIMAVRGLWGTNDQDAQAKRPSQDQISNKF
ncbi:MAG: tetratricopeptide repeat protein [Coxiellaceae bacterium]|nr:MAG: tetratricopeptide repeat protein [Coxiellaceae bacterium]